MLLETEYINLKKQENISYFLPSFQNLIFIIDDYGKEGVWDMEEEIVTSLQMVMEMLKSNRISFEDEMKLRNLIHKREDREREKRIAYELLGMLQKEVRYENNLGRLPVNQDKTDIFENFGAALYQTRMQAGITQQQLSSVGVKQSEISRIEKGYSNPSLDTMKRLADGLQMDLNIEFV